MKFFGLTFLLICVISSCKDPAATEIRNIYDNRQNIAAIFSQKSVFRKNTGNNVFLYTYKSGMRNEYVFTLNAGDAMFFREKVLFNPDSVLGLIKNEKDKGAYQKQLADALKFYLSKMDVFNISDVSSEFYKQGIDLKIYMKNKSVILYISNRNNVNNVQWDNYIATMNKLDQNWYYSMIDK